MRLSIFHSTIIAAWLSICHAAPFPQLMTAALADGGEYAAFSAYALARFDGNDTSVLPRDRDLFMIAKKDLTEIACVEFKYIHTLQGILKDVTMKGGMCKTQPLGKNGTAVIGVGVAIPPDWSERDWRTFTLFHEVIFYKPLKHDMDAGKPEGEIRRNLINKMDWLWNSPRAPGSVFPLEDRRYTRDSLTPLDPPSPPLPAATKPFLISPPLIATLPADLPDEVAMWQSDDPNLPQVPPRLLRSRAPANGKKEPAQTQKDADGKPLKSDSVGQKFVEDVKQSGKHLVHGTAQEKDKMHKLCARCFHEHKEVV